MEIERTRTLDPVTPCGAPRQPQPPVPQTGDLGLDATRSLEPSASHEPTPALASQERELAQGEQVGRYLVLGRLGRGGMGVVYKAYDPQLDRNVALKLLRSSSSGPDAGRRLLREARTLAQLRHPNVVDVYDTGLTRHGVFIAMELLEGDDVRQWLKQRPRRFAEILRVFREAGRGLLAAHESGFIHRDFKPANVLVGADGAVRVLDFGLAHSVEEPASDPSVERAETLEHPSVGPRDGSWSAIGSWASGTREVFTTEEGTVVGTPAFMAPEQLVLGHSDHHSDQYAFAMSLYVCLFDRSPPGGRGYEARLAAVKRAQSVSEAELGRSAAGERIPARVRRALLRALAHSPTDRFESMRELLRQLDPPAPRWRWSVAALTLALGFGAGASAFSSDEPAPCQEPAAALESAWGEPEREALQAAFARAGRDSLGETVETLDEYARSWTQMYERSCRATFIEHEQSERLFDQRMRCLDRRRNRLRSAVDSLVSARTPAELTARMVVPYRLPSLQPCGDLEALADQRPLPEDAEARQRVLVIQRGLDEAETSLHGGDYPAGIEGARAAVHEAEQLGHAPVLAEALGLLGRLLVEGGSAAEAERVLQRAIEVGAPVRDLRTVATSWVELLFAIGRQGRWDEARVLEMPARASVAMAGDPVLRAWLLNNLAFLYGEAGRQGEAIEALGQALEIKRAELGERHVDVGISWYNLGNARLDDGQLEAAAQAFERAQEIYVATVGQEHSLSYFARSGQCRVELQQGHPEAAVSLCEEVLEHFEQVPPSAMWISRVSFTLARAQWASGRRSQARHSAQRAWRAIAPENPEAAQRIERWLADPDGFTDD